MQSECNDFTNAYLGEFATKDKDPCDKCGRYRIAHTSPAVDFLAYPPATFIAREAARISELWGPHLAELAPSWTANALRGELEAFGLRVHWCTEENLKGTDPERTT